MKNTSHWQIKALLFLRKYLYKQCGTFFALYTKDIVANCAQKNLGYINFSDFVL